MYSVRPGSTIRLFLSRSRFLCFSSARCTRSYGSGTDVVSGRFWDGLGPLEFILLPRCWAESALGLGSTSLLMPRLQQLTTLVQWLCFVATGTAFGWIRVRSGSTTASTLMHAIYNATLFLCQSV